MLLVFNSNDVDMEAACYGCSEGSLLLWYSGSIFSFSYL